MGKFLQTAKNKFIKLKFINPQFHWSVLVKFFLVLGFILVVFGFYILFQIKNEQIFQVDIENSINPPSIVNEKLLEQVDEAFKTKEIRSLEIKNNQISFPDPSR